MKIGMRCRTCKSEDVRCDADAGWDEQTQAWELVAVYDNAVCENCGGETRIEEFEIDDDAAKI